MGDSGSWAVDVETNTLVRMLIAGCRVTKEAYVIPIDEIFTDIKRAVNKKIAVALPNFTWSWVHDQSSHHAPSLKKKDVTSDEISSNAEAYPLQWDTISTFGIPLSVRGGNSFKGQKSRKEGLTHGGRYECLYPGCDYTSARAYNLERHVKTHYPEAVVRLDCPYAWGGFCGRKGVRGFIREDHRKEHIRKVHPGADRSR